MERSGYHTCYYIHDVQQYICIQYHTANQPNREVSVTFSSDVPNTLLTETLKVYSLPACRPGMIRLSWSCDVRGWRTPFLYTLTTSVGSLGSARLSFTPAQHVGMTFGSRGVGDDVMLGAPAGQYNHLKNTTTVSHTKQIYCNTLTGYKEPIRK